MKTLFCASVLAMALSPAALAATPSQALLDHGQAVYQRNCAVCHSYAPPPKNAPPIVGISAQYHRAFTEPDKAVAYMAAYVRHPTERTSILAQVGMMRWPLMPPMNLPEQDLQAVAAWIWAAQGVTGPARGPMPGPRGGGY